MIIVLCMKRCCQHHMARLGGHNFNALMLWTWAAIGRQKKGPFPPAPNHDICKVLNFIGRMNLMLEKATAALVTWGWEKWRFPNRPPKRSPVRKFIPLHHVSRVRRSKGGVMWIQEFWRKDEFFFVLLVNFKLEVPLFQSDLREIFKFEGAISSSANKKSIPTDLSMVSLHHIVLSIGCVSDTKKIQLLSLSLSSQWPVTCEETLALRTLLPISCNRQMKLTYLSNGWD